MTALTSVSNRQDPLIVTQPIVGATPVPAGVPAPAPPSTVRWASLLAAAVILVLFSILFSYMIGMAESVKDTHWSRLLLLYNSVQTIVVAAASALLGFQVSAAQTSVAVARGADDKRQAEKLRANIQAFQADLVRPSPSAERGFSTDGSGLPSRTIARAMLLLH